MKFCFLWMAWGLIAATASAFNVKEFSTRDQVLAEFEASFKQGSVLTFFDKRDSDPSLAQCRVWLKAATDAYEKATAKGDIEEMDNVMAGSEAPSFAGQVLSAVGDEASRFLGSKRLELPDGTVIAGNMGARPSVSAKSGLVDLLQACGRCLAIVRVEKKTVYESEGWCKLPGKPTGVVEKGTKLLTHWENYPRKKVDGKIEGFNSILAFGLPEELEPQMKEIKQGDRAVIVVRTMGTEARGYFGDIFYKPQQAGGVGSFSLQFELPEELKGEDIPPKYEQPTDPITGEKYTVEPLRKEVVGKWFVDSEGVMRYYTKADFGVPPYDFMKRIAFSVMMDAVFHMHQKVK